MAKKTVDPTDRHVGSCIRMQRMVCGMSQTDLGESVGVTFQQVQKYEKGANRVSASRLKQIANVLKVAPDFFFKEGSTKAVSRSKEVTIIEDFISSRDGVALSLAFTKISDARMRRSIVSLVEKLTEI